MRRHISYLKGLDSGLTADASHSVASSYITTFIFHPSAKLVGDWFRIGTDQLWNILWFRIRSCYPGSRIGGLVIVKHPSLQSPQRVGTIWWQ